MSAASQGDLPEDLKKPTNDGSSVTPAEIRFTTRLTRCGCTVNMVTPVRTQVKRFRRGYACSEISAKRWIREQIEGYREYEKERKAEGINCRARVFFINGILFDADNKE